MVHTANKRRTPVNFITLSSSNIVPNQSVLKVRAKVGSALNHFKLLMQVFIAGTISIYLYPL